MPGNFSLDAGHGDFGVFFTLLGAGFYCSTLNILELCLRTHFSGRITLIVSRVALGLC